MLVRPLAGHGARALLDAGLTLNGDAPEELIARAIPVFLEHYADNICTFSAPYPGLELALEELRIEGFRLAISSEERRVGKECVSTCRSRWSRYPYNKKNHKSVRRRVRRSKIHTK